MSIPESKDAELVRMRGAMREALDWIWATGNALPSARVREILVAALGDEETS